MIRIAGCQLEPLDSAAVQTWLQFVLGGGDAPADLGKPAWLLCHCDDGVTWGRHETDGWHLGSSYFPDLCPVPSEDNVQEMRIFSSAAEVLIWRSETGLRGRLLRDLQPCGAEQPDRPDDEERLLLAGRVAEHRHGFTRVGDDGGAEQALPLRVTGGSSASWPRLRVRHYFARDPRTDCVRVIATRLVEVK